MVLRVACFSTARRIVSSSPGVSSGRGRLNIEQSFVFVWLGFCFLLAFKMPDHKICLTGQRTAELQEFDDLAASWGHESSVGVLRRTSSLLADRCEFRRLSSAFLAKDFDVKPSSLCTAAGIVTEASPPNALLTTSQSFPLTKKERSSFVAAKAEAIAAADDSGSKLRTSSRRIAPRRRQALKAQSRALKVVKPENVEIVAESRPRPRPRPRPYRQYRGVRVRPGVKGFLVEIRPRRWKKTIWLGTYTTSPEAARAYDAGVFYTGKKIPFNFQESEGTFPPLPEHLSIANSDPEVMDQIKWFVKEQAQKAAKRGGEEVPTQVRAVVPPQQTSNTSDKEGRSSVGLQYQCCSTLFSGKEEAGEHDVKDDEDHDDGRCDPVVTPNPFQNLEPLPYNLPHCSKQGLCHNDRDFFSGGMPLAVHEYMLPHASMVGDDDLLNSMQQISCLTEQVSLSSTWRPGNEYMVMLTQHEEHADYFTLTSICRLLLCMCCGMEFLLPMVS